MFVVNHFYSSKINLNFSLLISIFLFPTYCFLFYFLSLSLSFSSFLKVIGGELQERLIPVPYSKSNTDQAVSLHNFIQINVYKFILIKKSKY